MKELLARSWWMLALEGLVALVFGVLALLWPGLTLLWLVALFAAYAVLSGAAAIYGATRNRAQDKGWWLFLLFGLVSVAAGVLAVFYPGITALALVLLIGANALITGVLEIALAIRLRKSVTNEWLMVLAGVVSVASLQMPNGDASVDATISITVSASSTVIRTDISCSASPAGRSLPPRSLTSLVLVSTIRASTSYRPS